jgi:colanic acid biosynthesis glycosyl transferase WcaI
MRILMVTQIYRPEMGALANRLYPLTQELVAQGHEVHIATGMPNYPAGVVFPEYRGKRAITEELDGAKVHRTASYTTPRNQSRLAQLRSYLFGADFALGRWTWCSSPVRRSFRWSRRPLWPASAARA